MVLYIKQLKKKTLYKSIESKNLQMTTSSHNQLTCRKHNKQPTILVVNKAQYICQDCAIFDPTFRNEHLVDQEAVEKELNMISQKCSSLIRKQKELVETGLEKMNALVRSIEHYQVVVINQINNHFMEVKSKVSEHFMSVVDGLGHQGSINCKIKLEEVRKQLTSQAKIKKYHFCEKDFNKYQHLMDQQIKTILQVFEAMKNQVQRKVKVNIDIISAFEPVLTIKPQVTNNKIEQKLCIDEDLLDFSEFNIPQIIKGPLYQRIFESPLLQEQSGTFSSTSSCLKKNSVERRKTIACLEDSICSMDSLSQSIQTQAYTNFNVSQVSHHQKNPSLLSDRSVSCASTVSKYQQASQLNVSAKESLIKKSCIQISTVQQMNSKLLSIPPTIKSIRLVNLPVTLQQFTQVMRQKFSRSFITSLEIINCPKLNDKILMEIKSHKCKGLKKVEIKESGKEFNWADKRVKEIVKKLESQGVKVVY